MLCGQEKRKGAAVATVRDRCNAAVVGKEAKGLIDSVAVVAKEAKGLIDRKLEGWKAGRRVKKAEKKGKGAARVM